MDREKGTEEDHGSGWLEVRKKHRINAKLSNQKFSRGSSSKNHPYSCHYQSSSNENIRKLPAVKQTGSLKRRIRPNPDSNVSANILDPSLDEAGKKLECLDKLVSEQLSDHSLKVTDSTAAIKEIKDVPIRVDDLPTVKRGDVEDVSSTVLVNENLTERKDSECSNFAFCDCQKQQNPVVDNKQDVFVSSSTHVLGKNITSEFIDQFPDVRISSDTPRESITETWRDVSEVSSEYKGMTDTKSKDALNNFNESHGDSGAQNEEMNDLKSSDNCVGKKISNSEESVISNTTSVNSSLKNFPEIENENNDAKISAEYSTATVDVSTDGPDQGEDDQSEGKERFRERLWCFLFENMNRAVDELYLLCELECDMEQMNEAILVLEEAMSDFRELKCRERGVLLRWRREVPLPEKVLREARTDVRRMTTSPHRAEILSSSLEAFRKIQMDRASKRMDHDRKDLIFATSTTKNCSQNSPIANGKHLGSRIRSTSSECHRRIYSIRGKTMKEKTNSDVSVHNGEPCSPPAGPLTSEKLLVSASRKKEPLGTVSEFEKQAFRKDKFLADNRIEKQSNVPDMMKRNNSLGPKEKEKDKRNAASWRTMDAWKEKRNWEDILKSPLRSSSRVSCSPSVGRKSIERAMVLHDKLMSPDKKKKNAMDMRKEAEERHARAMRIRGQLENERLQRLQRVSEKFNRVNEWQADRSLKLREGLNARQQRSESRHEAHLAQVVKRAGDESSKVNEVRFITSLNEENKKLILRQKLHDSELRRAEKIQTIRIKQKEDTAREEAALERRKLLEAEKMQRLAETQRKKEEALLRREEERKASSAVREAKSVEKLRRKEIRAKAQQEEAELLAQKLAEKLSESEQRRKFYLEQIREKASTDYRDQSSPLLRRSLNREYPSRHLSTNVEDTQTPCFPVVGDSATGLSYPMQQQSLKRRIKRIRQRLMALKHEFIEPPFVAENCGVGYRAVVGTARVKIGKWLQELQRLRQARKEGAASIGLIIGDMIKFLEGKDLELHASRQAGLLDFISSALPASHTSKPEACQVTVFLLRLLRVVLSVPANRCYFLALNLLPPIIPMLSASLDNYIKIAASSNPGNSNLASKMSTDNMDTITEVLDCFLFTVTAIMGYTTNDERELQMQEGLLELIVSYQVIHGLRDLFALYDRPQVEGSPFPSSIMLSLNLLSVLTSRPSSLSSIDWEAGLSDSTSANRSADAKILDSNDVVDKFVMNDTSGDSSSPQLVQLPKTGFRKESSEVSVGLSRKKSASVVNTHSNGSSNIKLEEKATSGVDQEDQKITMDDQMGRKRIDDLISPYNSERKKEITSKHPVALLLSAMAGTGLVSLTSLLTAVLLQANNRLSSDQASYVLPSNFEEAAIGVLKVLNNLACLDISLLQKMLAMSDLRMEFFHLMSFLLSHCTSRWKSASDQSWKQPLAKMSGKVFLHFTLMVGPFLGPSLRGDAFCTGLLFFIPNLILVILFIHHLRSIFGWSASSGIIAPARLLLSVPYWKPSSSSLGKNSNYPSQATFVAACYGCEQNRGVIQQELSIDMLLTLLRSCRQNSSASQTDPSPPDTNSGNSFDSVSSPPVVKKIYGDNPLKSNLRGARNLCGKVGSQGTRAGKYRVQRENRGANICDDWAFKHNLPTSEASYNFMLHRSFPVSFLDKAEEFFAAGAADLPADSALV
ncbi:hypothetical protein KSP40_PGU021629 [Platanthera guangdongensis]|uniref:S phase cyclin A-associated protein in the endoplasmic reticulum N-terminal domain-containing protein n=1 Tax=Platanthera guangdongensis TaxID=2320717 RepID=A0ABR2LLQ3_9ASPA